MDTSTALISLTHYTILCLQPRSWEETQKAIQSLKTGMVLLLNLTRFEAKSAQRIAEYTAGSAWAIAAHHVRVGDDVLLIAPNQVKVTTSSQEQLW